MTKTCPRCGYEFPENPLKKGASVLKRAILHPGKALKGNKRGSKCEGCIYKQKYEEYKQKCEKQCVMERIV